MSWLKKIFSSGSRLSEPVDLSVLKTDMHSHFIPGIDDGSQSIEDSVRLIRGLSELGYKKAITTPHIMSDYYRNNPENIMAGLEKVREELQKQHIPFQLEAAAEYYLDFDFEAKVEQQKLLTFGSNYVLFEVSYLNSPDNLDQVIFQLQLKDYRPVLAHPERYPFWFRKFDQYEKLKDKGVLLQMNLLSLTGHYSMDTKKIAEQLIDKNLVDFLGTDCHHYGHIELLHKVRYEKHLKKLLESGRLLNHTL